MPERERLLHHAFRIGLTHLSWPISTSKQQLRIMVQVSTKLQSYSVATGEAFGPTKQKLSIKQAKPSCSVIISCTSSLEVGPSFTLSFYVVHCERNPSCRCISSLLLNQHTQICRASLHLEYRIVIVSVPFCVQQPRFLYVCRKRRKWIQRC